MKKSILALGAAAVVGGLGFAGSAHAYAYFGPGTGTNAATMQINPGGVGHELFVPYYTAQGNAATLLNIVNTDTINGKVVKVRFRGAANSDDVYDFTLYLSPGDVWSGKIVQNASTKLANISTIDTSCRVPNDSDNPTPMGGANGDDFKTVRFGSYFTDDQKAINTREGYVEILNMADVPPTYISGPNAGKANALFTATKHKNGVPPCTVDVIDVVSTITGQFPAGVADAEAAGLAGGTGGLMGGWIIIDQTNMAQFSGTSTAITARTLTGAGARANIAVSPQMEGYYGTSDLVTADPLLTTFVTGNTQFVLPQWFDFPDMSTPMVLETIVDNTTTPPTYTLGTNPITPQEQAVFISNQLGLGKTSTVLNEFLNDPSGGVPMSTDWVVSQPTRRYFAAVYYSGSAATSDIVYSIQPNIVAYNPYWLGTATGGSGVLSLQKTNVNGPQACLTGSFSKIYDREENTSSARPVTSPTINENRPYCGEVFTLAFGNSPLSAALTKLQVQGPKAGWAQLGLNHGNAPLPIIGFAAMTGGNQTSGFSVGATWTHRWPQ